MVSENFLQVNVYYEAMELSHHQEISIYDDYQFASDLGKCMTLNPDLGRCMTSDLEL